MIPAISIILPFYNPGKLLEAAINSILCQSFHDWELILIDNNSSDGSTGFAEQISLSDNRIKLIQENRQGIAYALNAGLAVAKGKYIGRMDADDLSHPERIRKQYDFLEMNMDIDVVSCKTHFHSEHDNAEGYKSYVHWQNNILSPEEHYLNRFVESPLAHPTVVFRRKLIDQFGLYSTDNIPEDYELWLRWMSKGVRFSKLEDTLLNWNDGAGRLSRTHNNYSDAAFLRIKCRYLVQWIRENISSDKEIIACGTSKECVSRISFLEREGIKISALTDVKAKNPVDRKFIEADLLNSPEKHFVINFIAKRGVGESIRAFLTGRNYREGRDFILAG
ncbi:MAG: glycosyltransferase family 2 protein [Cytophagaceae bacterium]